MPGWKRQSAGQCGLTCGAFRRKNPASREASGASWASRVNGQKPFDLPNGSYGEAATSKTLLVTTTGRLPVGPSIRQIVVR